MEFDTYYICAWMALVVATRDDPVMRAALVVVGCGLLMVKSAIGAYEALVG